MSGVSGANNEVTPQSRLGPERRPHTRLRGGARPARHGFQEDQQVRLPLVLTVEEAADRLGSEEPSCTRWSVRAPLSQSESVACARYQPTLWAPSLMH
jgi:hypothetical protein